MNRRNLLKNAISWIVGVCTFGMIRVPEESVIAGFDSVPRNGHLHTRFFRLDGKTGDTIIAIGITKGVLWGARKSTLKSPGLFVEDDGVWASWPQGCLNLLKDAERTIDCNHYTSGKSAGGA